MTNETIRQWINTLRIPMRPDEFESKTLVGRYGIDVPDTIRLLPGQPLDKNSFSYPCAVKVCSPDIFHKTDVSGVILGCNAEKLDAAVEEIRAAFPAQPVLVETQAAYTGPELILGIVKDPSLGHAVMVGAGGILTEIYQDAAFRLVPCSHREALHMIDELILSRVFEGFRGMRLDKSALAGMICHLSELAVDMGDRLSQLDINPIVFSGDRWVALDVKIVLEHNDGSV